MLNTKKNLSLITCLMFLLFSLTSVNAVLPSFMSEKISKIELSLPSSLVGKSLSVFYVSAKRPSFGMRGAKPKVQYILSEKGPYKISNKIVQVPSVNVPRIGVFGFTHVVLIVHDAISQSVGIRNIDGTLPSGSNQDIIDALTRGDMTPFKHRALSFKDKISLVRNISGDKIKLKF